MQKVTTFFAYGRLVLITYCTVLRILTRIIEVKVPDSHAFQTWLITELFHDIK